MLIHQDLGLCGCITIKNKSMDDTLKIRASFGYFRNVNTHEYHFFGFTYRTNTSGGKWTQLGIFERKNSLNTGDKRKYIVNIANSAKIDIFNQNNVCIHTTFLTVGKKWTILDGTFSKTDIEYIQ